MAKDAIGKVRFAFIEIEGSSEMIQDVIKTAAASLRNPATSRSVAPQSLSPQSNISSNNGVSVEQPAIEGEFVEEAEIDDDVSPRRPTSKPKKQRQYPTPEVLEVNLNEGEMPFAEYIEKKGNPTSHSKRYLLIAAWFKKYRGEPTITKNHIWTCYQFMGSGWTTGKDIDNVFHQGKANGWYKLSSKATFEITHIGINEVTKMGGED